MRMYEEAVYKIAKAYFHEQHDSMFARPSWEAIEMTAFIFNKSTREVHADVMEIFRENAAEWGK